MSQNEPLREDYLAELQTLVDSTEEWDAQCASGAIRHVDRNVDHDAYCDKQGDHASFARYDGLAISAFRRAVPRLLTEIARLKGLLNQ